MLLGRRRRNQPRDGRLLDALRGIWKDADSPDMLAGIVDFLQDFGYLPATVAPTVEAIVRALAAFQKFAGAMRQDGIPDEATLRVIAQPRCGCPDVQSHGEQAATRNPWRERRIQTVKWSVGEYLRVPGVSSADQLDLLHQAIGWWKESTGLQAEFVKDLGQAHVIVGVDPQSDGPSQRLAYTYLSDAPQPIPLLFDPREPWKRELSPTTGQGYAGTACHEFGHVLLNLGHSSPSDRVQSLMDPYSMRTIYRPQPEDIKRGQAVWGSPAQPAPGPAPQPVPPASGKRTFKVACKEGPVVTIEGLTFERVLAVE